MIRGTVCSGTGRASQLHTPERLAKRSEAAGMDLVPGTLNVRVENAEAALAELGEPRRIEEPWCRIGPGLDMYRVRLSVGPLTGLAFVTRSENSTARTTLEVMSPLHLRDLLDVWDGETVTLEAAPWQP